MSYFKQNVELLRNASEPLAARLDAMHDSIGEPTEREGFSIEPSKTGMMTVRYTDDEKSFFLHSPYDPVREAEQFAEASRKEHSGENFHVFFGMGLGYGVLETLKLIPEGDRVLIFEPHFDLFYLALCHTDLTPIMTRDNTTMSSDAGIQGALLQYMNLFELAGFKGVKMYSNDAFERLPKSDSFAQLADRLRYEMMAVGGNVQTLMVMGEMQQMNIILNFPHVLDNPPFQHLIGKFGHKPAIIVSAGPSLEKNVELLREVYDHSVIIAVDTAVKPLMARDIKPHIVVSGDPQEANYRHLKGVDLPDVYFVTEPQCPINSLSEWTGPKFICTFHDNMMRWVDRVLGDRGRVLVWGSVAVMAYDVAVKLGCDPIVFIGQDLSFPDGKTYTGGTVFETEDKQEMTVAALEKTGTNLIDMEDIYGNTIKTNRQMYAYFNFLKNRFMDKEVADRTIINATEGGILKSEKVTVMPLREAIDKYMQGQLDVWGILKAAHEMENDVHYTNLLHELDTLLAALRDAQEASRRGIEMVGRTLNMIAEDDDTLKGKRQVISEYNRLISLRKRLVVNPEAGKIIEMANQAGIYSFAQGVKNVKAEDGEIDNEFVKRACYHYHTLYKTMQDSIGRLIPPVEAARDAAIKRAEAEPVAVR